MIAYLQSPGHGSGTRPGLRLGLFLAVVALLPGVLALIAVGVGGAPGSGFAIAEATGAFSVAALQGLERKAFDVPSGHVLLNGHVMLDGQVALVSVAPSVSPLLQGVDLPLAPVPLVAQPADGLARILPLRL